MQKDEKKDYGTRCDQNAGKTGPKSDRFALVYFYGTLVACLSTVLTLLRFNSKFTIMIATESPLAAPSAAKTFSTDAHNFPLGRAVTDLAEMGKFQQILLLL